MADVKRKRRWLVWCSAIGLAVTLAAAGYSEFRVVSYREKGAGVTKRFFLRRSGLTVTYSSGPADVDVMTREVLPNGWRLAGSLPPDTFVRQWLPMVSHSKGVFDSWYIHLPLWMPGVVFGAGVWWGRKSGRCGEGVCLRCGYDVRGVVGGVCPECGRTTEQLVNAR